MPIMAERKLKIISSYCYGGSVRMNPEIEETERSHVRWWLSSQNAQVYLEGWGEVYNRKYCFNWDNDFVVIVRDKRVMKYTRSIIGLPQFYEGVLKKTYC